MQKNIALVILPIENMPIQIKVPGLKEYIPLYDSSKYKSALSLDDQNRIIEKTKTVPPYAIVETLKNTKDNMRHGVEHSQNHGLLMQSSSTYSAVNTNVSPKENKNLRNAYKNNKSIIGMEYIIPNLNQDALRDLSKKYNYIKYDK